jgi:DNA-binding NarL/FixJ family response regulator
MSGPRPLVAVGDLHLRRQIGVAIGFPADRQGALGAPLGAAGRRRARRRVIILSSAEVSRYKAKNPAHLNFVKRRACLVVAMQQYDPGKILEAIRVADGLVFCEINLERLPLITDLAESGYVAIPSPLASSLMNRGLRRELMRELSSMETRVLDMLGRGSSNRKIGEALGLDEGRTKYLIRTVFKKLRLQNRTQAAVFAQDVFRDAPGNTADPGKGNKFSEHLAALFS